MARARAVKLGRQIGQRPSDRKAKRVLGMHADAVLSAHRAQRGIEQEYGDGHRQAQLRRLIKSRQGHKLILCAPWVEPLGSVVLSVLQEHARGEGETPHATDDGGWGMASTPSALQHPFQFFRGMYLDACMCTVGEV